LWRSGSSTTLCLCTANRIACCAMPLPRPSSIVSSLCGTTHTSRIPVMARQTANPTDAGHGVHASRQVPVPHRPRIQASVQFKPWQFDAKPQALLVTVTGCSKSIPDLQAPARIARSTCRQPRFMSHIQKALDVALCSGCEPDRYLPQHLCPSLI